MYICNIQITAIYILGEWIFTRTKSSFKQGVCIVKTCHIYDEIKAKSIRAANQFLKLCLNNPWKWVEKYELFRNFANWGTIGRFK